VRIAGPIILSLGLAAALWLWTWPRAELQRQRLTLYQPVSATVVRTDVGSTATGRYQPVIEFRYQVGGMTYTATGPGAFTAAPGSGDLGWARAQVQPYTKDMEFSAFYAPAHPAEAFGVRQGRGTVQALALLAAPLLALMLMGLERAHVFSAGPAAMAGGPYDWYRLNMWSRSGGTRGRALMLAIGWYGYGAGVAWHYLACQPGVQWAHLLVLGLYALAGLAPVVSAARGMRVASRLAEAEIQATLPSFQTEGTVNIRVRQSARRKIRVRSATVSLICLQRTGLFAAETLYAAAHEFARDQELLPGFSLNGEQSFSIFRKKLPPSTPFSRWRLPRVEWQVEVVTQLSRGGTYRGTFPIILRQPQRQEAGGGAE